MIIKRANIQETFQTILKNINYNDPKHQKIIEEYARSVITPGGKINEFIKNLPKTIIIGDKEYNINNFLSTINKKLNKKNKTSDDYNFLAGSTFTILSYIHQNGDENTKNMIEQEVKNISLKLSDATTEEKQEEQEKQKEQEVSNEKINNIATEKKEKKEKKWTSELPGYLITGGVGGVSGVAGAFLRKKLPTWAAVSIIPLTVIPTAFLTEHTLPEGYKPEGFWGMFKGEHLKERWGHIAGKSLVGILAGLATYGLTRKFIK